MDLELKLKRLMNRMKEYEETLNYEGLGIFCQNYGTFLLNNEIEPEQEYCEKCIEKEELQKEWRKSRI